VIAELVAGLAALVLLALLAYGVLGATRLLLAAIDRATELPAEGGGRHRSRAGRTTRRASRALRAEQSC
jgi:hypothetical protein